MIQWSAIEGIPKDRKDGRSILLWADGDIHKGRWMEEPPGRKGWSGWEDPESWQPIDGATHYADINPPF